MAEHLCNIEVERAYAITLLKSEVSITRGLADNIERSALALGNGTNVIKMLFLDEQSHAFLTLVGNDFLAGEGGVADGQLGHVDESATILDQLAEAVDMTCRAMVVYAHDGVHLFFAQGAHEVIGTLLHLRVGTLYGIEFDTAAVATRVNAGDRASTETDAVVVTAHDHNLVAFGGSALQAIALGAVAHSASQHDNFVVAILFAILLVFEGEHGAGDERLSEFVAEVAGAVGGFDKDLLRRLIKPLTHRQEAFPFATFCIPGIAGHVHGRSGNGPRTRAATHTVADLTAGACAGAVEGFHGRGEVVGFGLEADDTLDILYDEIVAGGVVCGRKLFYDRPFGKSYVVLVGGNDVVGILLRGLLDHGKEAAGHFLSVDDERAAENLVATMLAVDLCKAKDLRVCQLAAELSFDLVEVFYFLGREC